MFKSFTTREEAEAYLDDRDVWVEQVAKDNAEGFLVAFTDGSFDKDLKRYSYGVQFILPDGDQSDICGYGSNPEYIDSNNIIGEILGVINALDWAVSNNFEKIKIYHDYEGLAKWITGEWEANSKVGKMYLALFNAKFKDVLEVIFVKVPGHSNVVYNEKADQLAKAALVDKKRVAVKGENWFSIPYFNQDDFNAFVEIIKESDENIIYTVISNTDKIIYKFKLNSDAVTVSFNEIEKGLPSNYPVGLKRLIKQSIINMTHYIESEEYSMYAFPALRALEGHIKYLITEAGGTVGRQFSCFGLDKTIIPNRYVVTENFADRSKNRSIENCYNYYKSQRDTDFHFGDILGGMDNTRFIETKEEADEIIKNCISLINTEQ